MPLMPFEPALPPPISPETYQARRDAILAEVDAVIARGPFAATWESLRGYHIPDWYQDSKFGIFIHWGVYAVPAFANEWYPRNMYQEGSSEFEHHVATYGPHTAFGYKDFIPQFKAEKYVPEDWAELFAEAGARFVMPVAEHHDGFAMYDTVLSRWNAVQMGPRRDVVGDLATALRDRGLIFSASSHRAEHFWFLDGGKRFPSDVQAPEYADFYGPAEPAAANWHDPLQNPPTTEFLDDWLARTCELVDRYRPRIVWFDWWIMNVAFVPYLQRFAAFYYNRGAEWGEEVAINYKDTTFPEEAAVFDVERGQLADIRARFWQTDTAVAKNSWCYTENNEYKAPEVVLHDLIDIVSKNGALLLNIGPRADGTIPDEDAAILRFVGRWLAANGEAIYGSRPWKIFGEGPTAIVEGTFNDTRRAAFTAEDIRFTKQGDTLYAIALGWPESGEIVIRSLGSDVAHYEGAIGALSLVSGEPLSWRQEADALRVRLPEGATPQAAVALRITPAAKEQ